MLSVRSTASWLLGYPESAIADTNQALNDARQISHMATLAFALVYASGARLYCGDYVAATALADELVALTVEKEMALWEACGRLLQGQVAALTGKWADAVEMITTGLIAWRSTGSTLYGPFWLSSMASARAELGQFDAARGCLEEALTEIETRKERWCEAEVNRIAGEIARQSPERDTSKAEGYFERALAVARQQQAKSLELRASVSLARLRRDQGKVREARDLLAPVYRSLRGSTRAI
jgi:predicted ATPase